MKTIPILFSFFFLMQISFGQIDNKKVFYKPTVGKYFVNYFGSEYRINDSILTVKLNYPNKIPFDLQVMKSNPLGYLDIRLPSGKDLLSYYDELKQTNLFESIEFNSYGLFSDFVINDINSFNQWYLSTINAFHAWEITTGDPSIIVAVLDNGVEWSHSDLGLGNDWFQNIFINPGEDQWSNPNHTTSGNHEDDDNNGFEDDLIGWNFHHLNNDTRTIQTGHGTLISGIIGAKTNNTFGIAGIAGGNNSPGVKILPIKIGEDTVNMAFLDDAILYAINMGAKVIQLSFNGPTSNAINAVVDFACDNNVTVICSSGNFGLPYMTYPASLWQVISVGATKKNNNRWEYSNYGDGLDVVAPGEDIYSSTINNGFSFHDGTSYSSPMVSGITGLMLSVNNNLNPYEVVDILQRTAQKAGPYIYTQNPPEDYPWNEEMGYGLVDAYAAVKEVACSTDIYNTNYSANVTFPDCGQVDMENIIVKESAVLTIDNAGTVVIKNIESRDYSTVSIGASGAIHLENTSVKPNTVLEINGNGTILINGTFRAEAGSFVSIQ
jgi:subtilisin family serine protease